MVPVSSLPQTYSRCPRRVLAAPDVPSRLVFIKGGVLCPRHPDPHGAMPDRRGDTLQPLCKVLLPQNMLQPQVSLLGHRGKVPGTSLSPGTCPRWALTVGDTQPPSQGTGGFQ